MSEEFHITEKEEKEKTARENYEKEKQPKNDFPYPARQKNQLH